MIAPAQLQNRSRLMPLWGAIPLLVVSIVFGAGMLASYWHGGDPDWRGWLSGGPVFALIIYGSLVFVLVRAHVDVDASGVSVYYKPIPCGMPPRTFAREEIAAMTLDHIHMSKEGWFWRIGLELRDGRQVVLPERYEKEEEARARVAAINDVLAQGIRATLPIGSIRTPCRKRDWTAARPVLLWGGVLIAALVWAGAVELSR